MQQFSRTVGVNLVYVLLFSYTVVDVEFAQPSYTVGENDGSVSVCINISGAVLERNVTVFLSTEGFDATCKLLLMFGAINNMQEQENSVLHKNTYQFSFSYLPFLVAPNDYTAVTSQPVTFSSAPSQMCVSITIINDFMIEPNELFNVVLESTDPAVQLTMAFASVTILDSCKFVA